MKRTVAEALAKLPGLEGQRFATIYEHGTLLVEIYAPRGVDPQKPHTRDEIYVIISGTGIFLNGEVRRPFEPGEVLFVPAGVEHHFEEFTPDFATWVFFYGPAGGEAAKAENASR